ncbi:hypothetical protein IFR04_007235 [Cadophora malorum]|uniref:Uncharacterized protein n=1 Tax=Cadophora malorum TaxID=108018 RepID=A0A8H7WAI1_9HELO|nr:hypothetical protein IFR04_007235 [Cadophora malorum]
MYFSRFISVLPIVAGVASAIPYSKRAGTEDVTIYAYGTNISGLALYSGNNDGLAYIASAASADLTAITWDVGSTDTTWNATRANSTTSIGSFFIVDTDSAFTAAGFLSSNSTTPTDAITTGFKVYGGQVVLVSNGTLLSQFWATTTDTEGVYSLMWNSAGTSQDNSVPVALKTMAPSTTTT